MRRPTLAAVLSAATLCLASLALAPSASADPGHGRAVGHRNDHVCSTAPAGQAACQAIRHDTVAADGTVVPNATAGPSGYGPADIQSAYNFTGLTSGAKTVAIVDAYDDPTAEADLGAYRSQYGLTACTTANGCFSKVNQYGVAGSYPSVDGGWAQEISLDLDMVSAACPDCHILLVEASTASFANLGTAVNTAANTSGVVAVSNSYGGSDSTATSAYNHPGIAITASTGDNGYGVQSPASFPYVVAVGGTSLRTATNARGWTETAWSGAGSGCSRYNANPGWQTGTSCSRKANADVSAVADPNTGVAVYDSTAYQGSVGWMVFGGTSASSPIIASAYALGGGPAPGEYAGHYTWTHQTGALNDVTSGSNGRCTTKVWCNARTGWDGPTGLGTPNGVGAF